MSIAGARRFVGIGDIHGDDARLERLLGLLAPLREPLIFVGDYVNRGRNSAAVLERLIRLREERLDTCFLLGNHDFAFARYLAGADFVTFARMGGIATIKSYIPETVEKDVRRQLAGRVPEAHTRFLTELRPYWENEGFLVSHAGFDPQLPDDRSTEAMALQDHPGIFSSVGIPGKVAVCGHYAQASGRPFVGRALVCLDTGCGTVDGLLTAMLFPDGVVYAV